MEQLWLTIKFLLLGLFQGLTEPIPISSSGHLLIAQYFLDVEIEGSNSTFALLVNSASLIAVLIIYREDIKRLIINGLKFFKEKTPETRRDFMFVVYLVVATIPAGIIGVLFQDVIDSYLSTIVTVGVTLVVTGLALWFIRNMRGQRKDGNMTMKDAIIIGGAQAVALIPGISRSGATIVAAMARGINQETALRFSFLLFIPVSLGGAVLSITDIINDDNLSTMAVPYIMAFIGSLVASYFSLKWFMNIMAKGQLKYFAIYCFIVGPLVVLAWFLLN
ncbi:MULTISPECIES: undecaprenyl-diphosphate phosphatase [unclassified Planococcus (in: firmicutes)]|uniref:undecaprenyl-diphosphate phosphatase n=1 Tax=Planococcus TaxID=1372 RepID=UPI000C31CC86|nr:MULTISPECIES: undecaprenyl-diphosphate phosphatase [unclassified Planococcus (in: firmicutes)]AUD12851.1 UDP pyrophosphate phosphatase [Planococcus sp. MB-3u-03]PKG47469.1 UDP pyrophosphate phosphatase [Planococcus sp. Urea-trap-24]PKG88207.1 UDP pyrophosphate phosphatase [Planococcus sp. Urea-3u-39]PKH36868.1 UDP pyrophosphate phosphatase [Planococcus sp. MB-3u-09]